MELACCSSRPAPVISQPQTLAQKAKRKSQTALKFSKYQGLGNDFLIFDNRDSSEPKVSKDDAIKLCNRNFGVGSDGVILVMPGVSGCNCSMRVFTPDGFEPDMCGSGVLCTVRFLADQEEKPQFRNYRIHTKGGSISPIQRDTQIFLDMGVPVLNWNRIPTSLPGYFDGTVIKRPLVVDGKTWLASSVNIGTPHCITFGDENEDPVDFDEVQLEKLGPLIENHEKFPHKTNAEFVEVASRSHLKVRMWERSPGATRASGACAAVIAGVLEGRVRHNCTVELEPGGKVEVEWRESDQHVYMTATAERIFSGAIYL